MRRLTSSQLWLVAGVGRRGTWWCGVLCQQRRVDVIPVCVDCVYETTVGHGYTEANSYLLVRYSAAAIGRRRSRHFMILRLTRQRRLAGLRRFASTSLREGPNCSWRLSVTKDSRELLGDWSGLSTSLSWSHYRLSTWTHEATPCTRTGYRYVTIVTSLCLVHSSACVCSSFWQVWSARFYFKCPK